MEKRKYYITKEPDFIGDKMIEIEYDINVGDYVIFDDGKLFMEGYVKERVIRLVENEIYYEIVDEI